MLFIGIGFFFIIGGLSGIYIASQMKPHLLMRPSQKREGDTEEDPFRGGEIKIEEFIKENIVRKIVNFISILLFLVGIGFIYKSIILEVPADRVAIRYLITGKLNTVPLILVKYGPGWHIINPFKIYMIKNIYDIYDKDKCTIQDRDLKTKLRDRIQERNTY